MASQAKQIIVFGRVQGVGFRYFVQQAGSRLGLGGNVSNCPDDTVEIVVEGEEEKIAQLVKEVRKGPPLARIERLVINDIPAAGRRAPFRIEGW